ncbi:hypothetical protein DEO72_LG6g1286 [Vigna unguiculata]|uniref:Uncharacterized protein n=1 Tax=Vigna unguiculata TaxID=3917 RepID=A0A4D6M7B7_VIGUN|nr:hypothetical protein DEO72_LG6g1286 [Vigna unguiculata]
MYSLNSFVGILTFNQSTISIKRSRRFSASCGGVATVVQLEGLTRLFTRFWCGGWNGVEREGVVVCLVREGGGCVAVAVAMALLNNVADERWTDDGFYGDGR